MPEREHLGLSIEREGDGAYAVVTLDDPERRNMLSATLVSSIVSAFDEIEADASIGAVVVTGAGRAFCAGADLGALSRARPGAGAGGEAPAGGGESVVSIYEGFLRVARCRLPTVAAVNGPAVGAGMNLALACDVRVMASRGRFECRFAELGLHPGGGHTWMLSRIVGPETAAAMVLFSEVLSADRAVERGLAWRCVEDAELLGEAGRLAGAAARAPRDLLVRIKESLSLAGVTSSHEEAVAYELEAQLWSMGQPFFAERLEALRARISGGSRTT